MKSHGRDQPPDDPRWRTRVRGWLLVLALGGLGVALSSSAGCASTSSSAARAGIPMSPVPLYGKFVWHDLVTHDRAAAKRFYGELLGWEFKDVGDRGRPYSLIKARGQWMGGILDNQRTAGPGSGSQWLGYLSVPDVDRAVEQVRAGGGQALVGPLDVQNIGRAAVVTDPQGAPVGLVRSQPGDPADTGLPEVGQFLWMEHLARDADAAVSFYQHLLGYQVEEKTTRIGPYYLLVQGGPRAGVVRLPIEGVLPNWLTYVRVEDPAALVARVPELGGRVVMAPRPDVRGGSLALVADPSGAVIALQKYPFQDPGATATAP